MSQSTPQDLPPPDLYDPVIEVYKKDIDRTLLRENLKLSVAERCRRFEQKMRLIYQQEALFEERRKMESAE